MKSKSIALAVAAALGGLAVIPASQAGGVTFRDGDKYMKLGGRVQMQYHYADPDGGKNSQKVVLRRLRPYIAGSVHPGWKGKFQWDMGDAEGNNEIAIKDAYMEYTGIKNLKVFLGNAYFPFSREDITSSKHQQLVERTFVGDHNYGSPERNVGIHLHGQNGSKIFTWRASFAQAAIDPSNSKLDFDTPVNKNSDFNLGWIYGGRVSYHPFGFLKMSQGDFKRQQKATISLAAFKWANNDDVQNLPSSSVVDTTCPTPTACPVTTVTTASASTKDVDDVTGIEISAAYRNMGISIDAEYNRFDASLKNGTVTKGLYKKGDTTLENWSVEGGYMVVPSKLEIVAGYQSQDADGYQDQWTRTSVGLNWFVAKQDIKYQLTYRQGSNVNGVSSNSDENELFAQAQYVF